ncbi:MAG: hypothetical protein KBH81_05330 [Phycisphaerae bacterium]|jgi:hypothetical protein|nr:hypothetical protein [Phycisphaerae bacterium]HPC22410.1 hypothetical protein [Phycisphaerae bacterium]HRS29216.1 hypothetical protein [Phycisphaerae bacterium]HRT42627.1 hypothetical protein [Phycisphaerae bacterium]
MRLCLLITVIVCGAFGAAELCAQVVSGDVTAAGFRTSQTAMPGYAVRAGHWIPIQVQLSAQGTTPFQGQLRLEAPDLDGDLVSYREGPVALNFEAGAKRAWCYAVWSHRTGAAARPVTLDVLTDAGLPVSELNVPDVEVINNDALLLLDISNQPVTRLRGALLTPGGTLERGDGVRPFYRDIVVAAMPAGDLPERWFGLEAVDIIVWDKPTPADPAVASKLDALQQWVRSGGQLVVGLGASWPVVQKSGLAELLPVQSGGRGGGQTIETDRLDEFFRRFGAGSKAAAGERVFRAPISVAAVEARPGAVRVLRSPVADGAEVDLIAAHWIGSGSVIALAAGLDDLTQAGPNQAFYSQLLGLNPTTPEFLESELKSIQATLGLQRHALYDSITRPIALTGAGTLLVFAAVAFVVVYIALATVASWWWLRRHRLATLGWTTFAAIAVVASAVSLLTVSVTRGLSRGLATFSFVDLEAGSRAARGTCYFGYSSPLRTSVDLSLAGAGCFLRPLSPGPAPTSWYATPQRYAATPANALLESTPLRATLKQFEGLWQGELNGAVRCELTIDRRSGELTAGSWLQNDLDVPIAGGYLLYTDPRLPGTPLRAAGQTATWSGWKDVPPALNIIALPVPALKPGEKVSGLGQEEYARLPAARQRWQSLRERKFNAWPDLLTLYDLQQDWVGARTRAPAAKWDQTVREALLASTRNFYLHVQESNDKFEQSNGRIITTDGLMDVDVCHWLMQGPLKGAGGRPDVIAGQGFLLLYSDVPGPAQLQREGKPVKPNRGACLYRVRVPLQLVGTPPAGPPETGNEL